MTIKLKGELEIDQERGIIYFHEEQSGWSVLRICRLPTLIPDPRGFENVSVILLDITHMVGVSWSVGEDNSLENSDEKLIRDVDRWVEREENRELIDNLNHRHFFFVNGDNSDLWICECKLTYGEWRDA